MRLRSLFPLVLFGLFAFVTQAQVIFEWEQRASLPGAGRWGAFTFELNGYGYVAGGNAGGSFMSDVWRYDPLSDSWSQVANMPLGRSHGASWSMNGKGYVSCGHLGSSYFSNSLWEYDPVLDQWSTKAPLPANGRYGPHGFGINGYGYIGGGNIGSASGPFLADMWRYDAFADEWTEVSGIPDLARYGATAFVIGDKAYAHGGRDQSMAFNNELWEYAPSSDSWMLVQTMPGPGRSWMMVMPFATDAVVSGGAENGVITYEAFRYIPSSDNWTQIPDYPGESGWSGASFMIYGRVFGGLGRVLYPTNSYNNDFWELIKIDQTALVEHSAANAIQLGLFPNPVVQGGSISLRFDDPTLMDKGHIRLLDALGRVVQEQPFEVNREITLRSAVPGSYTLICYDRKGSVLARAKLVIQ